jgi:hypothetical protein
MENGNLYTLIPLEEFKTILGIDDREDKITKFCLVTSTLNIEQYCKRRLLRKKHFERIELNGDLLLPLKDYPVTKTLAVFVIRNEQLGMRNEEVLEPEFYGIVPDCGLDNDIPFSISLSPALKLYNNFTAIKAVYWAGYPFGKIPTDLSAACLELASWNLNRYRGKHIGMTGNTKTEHLELSMPENVKQLLEPYRRKTI